MTTIPMIDTRVRAASAVLEAGLVDDVSCSVDPDLDRLAREQVGLQAAVASLIARMQEPDLTGRELDRLTRDVTRMLALSEDLRRVRARAVSRRAGSSRRWRERLSID